VYTNKDKMKVVLFVEAWRIEGDMHVLSDSRLTDALNSKAKEFLVVTDAKIFDATSGALIHEAAFLDVNRLSIALVYSAE
jgi:hypothetical protein